MTVSRIPSVCNTHKATPPLNTMAGARALLRDWETSSLGDVIKDLGEGLAAPAGWVNGRPCCLSAATARDLVAAAIGWYFHCGNPDHDDMITENGCCDTCGEWADGTGSYAAHRQAYADNDAETVAEQARYERQAHDSDGTFTEDDRGNWHPVTP